MDSYVYTCNGCGALINPEDAFSFIDGVYCTNCLTKIDRMSIFSRSIAFRRAGAYRGFNLNDSVNKRLWDAYITRCTYCLSLRIGKREEKLCNCCAKGLGNHLENHETIFLFADNLAEELLIDIILESCED